MGQSILLAACGMVPLLVEALCQAIQRAHLYDHNQCYISIGQRHRPICKTDRQRFYVHL